MAKGNKKTILVVAWLILLGGLLFGITHFNMAGSQSGNTEKTPPAPKLGNLKARWPEIVAHAAAPPRGNPHARYTMAEFGDFQCPQCGKVYPMLEKLLKEYPDQANLIFVDRPFPDIHRWAIPASTAAQIAASHGKFWQMYDKLYTHQDDLEPGFYDDYAAAIGINKAQFATEYKNGVGSQAVEAASKFSDDLGILETPTVVLHDNVSGATTVYIGLSGASAGGPPAPGIKDLVAKPPWLAQEPKK